MSKNNNVNPGQYKVAGRERPGQDIPEPERSPGNDAKDDETAERWRERQRERADDAAKARD